MELTFIGVAHEVTGSCSYIKACGKNILIDCGMEQGVDTYENVPIPVSSYKIDYVILTHAHIDHSGLLPLLYKNGFRGEIHATEATCGLCNIMLRDSAHIQMFEAEWKNRKRKRSGHEPFEPIYDMDDANGAIGLLVPHAYNSRFELCNGINVSFSDAGHLLGSACPQIEITEDDITRKIVFSGDLGNRFQPLLREPEYIKNADYIVMESTYGTREHKIPEDYAQTLADVLQKTFDRSGNVIIPSFAVGRTQELLYFLRIIKEKSLVKGHDDFLVYVDSPLAVEATNIFNQNASSCFDKEALEFISKGINPMTFDGLKLSVTTQDSIAINMDKTPKVIISASGMCEAGRIRHHLKHNLWQEKNSIVFVGFQAPNTLGRLLLDGVESVKLFGEEISVKAQILELPGISAHADRNGLLDWLFHFEPKPIRVFINHGQSEVCEMFTAELRSDYGYVADAPYSGTTYDLTSNTCTVERKPVPIKKARKKPSAQYDRLVAAAMRLLEIAKKSRHYANKETAKFANQIISLCDKWETNE